MGRGIAVVLVSASVAFASLASLGSRSALADPDDEIEMDPDGAKPPAKPPDPKKPDAKKPDQPKKPETGAKTEPQVPPDAPPPDAPVKDPKLAKKLVATAQQTVAKADQLVRAKKVEDAKVQYEAALVAYTKAIELGDDPNVLYELGLVEDKLGKTAQAATHWRTLIKTTAGVRPDIVKKTQAKFDEAATKVGQVTLAVKPDGVTVTLENVERGKTPLAAPLILMPGTYSFQLLADGFQLKTVEVTVDAGSESERAIDLEPIKITIDTRPPIEPDKPVVAKAPSKLPIFIGGGAAVGLIAIGTVTGILAVGQHGTFTAGDSSSADRDVARSNGKTLAHVTDGMLVGAVVAGGFTAYWYFLKYKPAKRKFGGGEGRGEGRGATTPTRRGDDVLGPKATLVPWVQPDAGGLTLGGRF